ncbi:hypothetical protein FOXYS1_1936 [Fusarium oxysporum]|uniref:Uncharacterized protein n=1 Tax=Fusarium oxysporum TaxID=5507 RepID=A0A8H5AM84_FUSOX|nr:hypothetical protein FOXYS1_1936 [Fusarium oxysporum]
MLFVVIPVALASIFSYCGYAYFYPSVPSSYTTSQAGLVIKPGSSLGRTCDAHKCIEDLYTVTPELSQTLFQIIGVDPKKHPLSPQAISCYRRGVGGEERGR